MVSVFYNCKMNKNIKVNGLITKNMVSGNIDGLMDVLIEVVI